MLFCINMAVKPFMLSTSGAIRWVYRHIVLFYTANMDGTKFTGSGGSFQPVPGASKKPVFNEETPKIVRLLVRYSGGLIKDVKQAVYALWVFAAIMIIGTLILFYKSGDTRPPLSPNTLLLTPNK